MLTQVVWAVESAELSDKVESLSRQYRSENKKLNQTSLSRSLLESRLDDTVLQIQDLDETLKQLDQLILMSEKQKLIAQAEFQKFKKKLSRANFETLKLDDKLDLLLDNYNSTLLAFYMESISDFRYTDPAIQLFDEYGFNLYLQNLISLQSLEETLKRDFQELDLALAEQKSFQKNVLAATINLQELKGLFETRVFQSEVTLASKKRLLEFTKGEQKIYESLLEKAIHDHKGVEANVLEILKNYSKIKNQFFDKGFADDIFFGKNKSFLDWPVSPAKGLTAYFRDTSYKNFFGIAHHAIDIRASMGTAVLAPADGVVLKVVGGEGNDYHYIMIAHADGVVSLFGHLYDEYVKQGDKVKRGQTIGLTGGMPGTKGAGFLTTGPHLHFELFKNGEHIDPLSLLDQSKLKSSDLLSS